MRREPVLAVLLLAAGVAASLWIARLPGLDDGRGPESAFSSGRAFAHVREIARAPHPVGSPEHSLVRERIVNALVRAGYQPELQRSSDPIPLVNVLARLRGLDGRHTILVVSHYDTKPTAPGAGDDGASVAVMLEAARALRANPVPLNDVLFLFTDGEEAGLLGAEAFVREHPAFAGVDLVLNCEARGSAGRSLMFQTSLPNEWLVSQYAEATTRPASNSLMADVYRRMPNDTDFTVFDRAGVRGLNYAFIGGYTTYHTPEDTLGNLDPASLAHHGKNLFEAVTRFADADLDAPPGGRVVYFDVLGRWLVVYSEDYVLPLVALAALFWLLLVRAGVRRHVLRLSGVAAGAGATLLAVAVTALLVLAASRALLSIFANEIRGPVPGTRHDGAFFLLFFLLALLVHWLVSQRLVRRSGTVSRHAGALLVWLLLSLAGAVLLPSGSFLFLWPLLFGLVGLAWMLPLLSEERHRRWIPFVTAAAGLPVLVLLLPFVREFLDALALGGAAVPFSLTSLGLSLFTPLRPT